MERRLDEAESNCQSNCLRSNLRFTAAFIIALKALLPFLFAQSR